MGVKKTYEAGRDQAYATPGHGQIVSRSLFAVVERGDMPLDGGFGEAEIIEVETSTSEPPMRVRVDTVPQDTIAISPDAAAKAATVMQGLSNSSESEGILDFRVEYAAD